MKKLFAVLLTLILVLASVSAPAEEAAQPPFATIGDALDKGERCSAVEYGNYYVAAVEWNGKYYRAVAELDEEAAALNDAINTAEDLEAAFAAYDAHIRSLPVAYVEEFTAPRKDQAELDSFVGKTIQDLENAGYEYGASGTEGGDEITFSMLDGVYSYRFVVDCTPEEYLTRQETSDYGSLRVTSAGFEGLSYLAAHLNYHADGIVEEEQVDQSGMEWLTGLFGGVMTGGWSAAADPAVTEEIRALLDKGIGNLIGVEYEPVAYLGTQVVAGTNHAILCLAQVMNGTGQHSWKIVYLYEDLQGSVSVLNIADFDIGALCTYGAEQ